MRKTGPRILEALADYDPLLADEGVYDWYLAMVPRRDLVGVIGTEDDCLANRQHRMTKRDWEKWSAQETEWSLEDWGYDRMEALADYWMPDPSVEPVEVTYDNEMTCLSIWDGHHRIALAVLGELKEVPAYVGLPVGTEV